MSQFFTEETDEKNHSDHFDDDNYEDDDLLTFQLNSKKINIYYSSLTKYSKLIRENYLFSDVINRLPQEVVNFQNEFGLSKDNVFYFFQLFQQNYNIQINSKLTYKQCIDFLKLSKYLKVRKIFQQINKYIKNQKNDVDFTIQMIQHELETRKETENNEFQINLEIENLLSNRISECLMNEKFFELPISIIYRIVEKSSKNEIDMDNLFNFIKKSLKKFYTLFQFLDLEGLSDEKLSEICELYIKSDEKDLIYFDYLKCNLKMINRINDQKKNFQLQLKKSDEKSQEIQTKLKETEEAKNQIQAKLDETEKSKNQIDNEKRQIQSKLEEAIEAKNQIQAKLDETENKNKQQKIDFDELNLQFNQLQKQLEKLKEEKDEILKYKNIGQINATVKNELIINAKIDLKIEGSSLDTTKSKYIISQSNAKTLGIDAYENGELITSPKMNTVDFICKAGTYYVRCIVFNNDQAQSNELVSNAVTTTGSSALFSYEGQPNVATLIKGKYKLEVWGAKGGDSTGTKRESYPQSEGGLGGYSCGILNLLKNEKIYVYVGGEGQTANSLDGEFTNGGFPDGGGTKTGHQSSKYTSVPGTGGGSTSFRVTENSDYARVIVAGGGGGASGSSWFTDHGGFGGGLCGGNSCYFNSQRDCGSGTQTGCTGGKGGGSNGDPGVFGNGATGKYESGRDSGGGGGGGWYGGGSGGYGNSACPGSGGGGSGWIFTESSFNVWKSGDSANASKFVLNSSYYLTEAVTLSGKEEFPNPNGNGKECGHRENGYAKITPI